MQIWKRSCLLACISVHLAPAIDVQGDKVVFPCAGFEADADFVVAVNRTTGKTAWTYGDGSSDGSCKLLGWNKDTMMCSSSGSFRSSIHGVRLSDGKRQWQVQAILADVGGIDTMLEHIYLFVWRNETSWNPCLQAVSTKGKTLWTQCGFSPWSTDRYSREQITSGEICADELCKSKRRVLLVTQNVKETKVYALDSQEGTKLWDFSIGWQKSATLPTTVTTIAPDGKTVLVAMDKGPLRDIALDAFSGKQKWIKNGAAGNSAAFSKDGSIVYVNSFFGAYAASAHTGDTVWNVSDPVGGKMSLALSIDGQALFELNYDGSQRSGLWTVDPTTGKNRTLGHLPRALAERGFHSLDAQGEAIYVRGGDKAAALSTKDASLLWTNACKPPSSFSPTNLVV